jgi:nucleoside-diphosphate-sugar epimerase
MSRVVVFGGSGFVGSAITALLRQRGDEVTVRPAPRLWSEAATPHELVATAAELSQDIVGALRGYDNVVNAAGLAHAPSGDSGRLTGANSLLPSVLQQASRSAGVARFIHLSSAAVQGRVPRLDEELTHAPDSAYSRSKALGEAALAATRWESSVILRPTSVHGPDRQVTLRLARLARSALSVVEAPGDRHTPQVHVDSVARAVGVLVDPRETPPQIVLQPSEGFSVQSFMSVIGCGRQPRSISRPLSRSVIFGAYTAARFGGSPLWAQARRVELLLRGQEQVRGWLGSRAGIVATPADWQDLASECATRSARSGPAGTW